MAKRGGLIWMAAALPCVAACTSPEQKAAAAEARYDAFFAQGAYPAARVEILKAVAAREDVPGPWLKLGRVNLVLNDLPGAYGAFQRVYELQRDNVEALGYLAQIAVAGGDLDQAQDYIDSLTVLQPNDLRGLMAQASIAQRESKPAEALRILDGVIQQNPALGDALVMKAAILDGTGRTADGIKLLEDRIAGAGPGQRALLDRLLDLYRKTNDEAGLRATYARLFRIAPDNVGYQTAFAQALSERGETAEARQVLARAQAQYPADPEVQIAAVRLVRATTGPAAAVAEARRIAAAGSLAMKAAVADELTRTGAAPAAWEILAPSLADAAVSAANADAQTVLAAAERATGRLPAARARLDRVIAFDQTNAAALLARSDIELAAGQLDAALNDAQRAATSSPDVEAAQLKVAQVYIARKEWLLANAAYSSAVQAFPASLPVLNSYTGYLVNRRDLAGAMQAGRGFLRANPASVPGWAVLARLCVQAHDDPCVGHALENLGKLNGGAAVIRQVTALRAGRGAAGRG